MVTVDFVNPDDTVEHRVVLEEDTDYISMDHGMLGEYTVDVDGKCRVLHQDGFDMILGDESCDVELIAGNFIVIAHTGVEVPDWDELNQEFYSSSE